MKLRIEFFVFTLILSGGLACQQKNAISPDVRSMLLRDHPALGSGQGAFEDYFVLIEAVRLSGQGDQLLNDISTFDVYVDGSILAANPFGEKEIFFFSPSGKLISKVGVRGVGSDEYTVPMAVCFGKEGQLFVYDIGQKKVLEYGRSGDSSRTFSVGKLFTKMIRDANGDLVLFTSIGFSSADDDETVFKYSPTGRFLSSYSQRSERFTQEGATFGGGLASNTGSNAAKKRIEFLLTPLSSHGQDTTKVLATIYLMLRSPGCEACTAEMFFWNAEKFGELFRVVALFPGDGPTGSMRVPSNFRMRLELLSMNGNTYEELAGRYPPFVTRFVLSSSGRFVSASRGEENDTARKRFADELMRLKIDHQL